ncbi:hypothetical protein, conserved [Leishmania shawi]|uniref:Uncharacterized protein n=1 Tax=Leishmania shawi TaxID=5680 RepID=A0ABR3E539_9TRYP
MESLHLALGQYERGDLESTGDCLPRGALLFRHQEPSQSRCVGHAITDSEALEAERGNRTRAEEQLTRCDAAMRRLRDGTAPPQKKRGSTPRPTRRVAAAECSAARGLGSAGDSGLTCKHASRIHPPHPCFVGSSSATPLLPASRLLPVLQPKQRRCRRHLIIIRQVLLRALLPTTRRHQCSVSWRVIWWATKD